MKVKTFVVGAFLALLALFPSSVQAQGYEQAIYEACARYGCDGDQLVRVANCESNMNPYAVNPITGDYGLFQINLSIWGEIKDPYAQIEFAAEKFASGQGYLWVCQ